MKSSGWNSCGMTGTSGVEHLVSPLEMCNFQTISLPFVVYLLEIKFCEDSLEIIGV